MNVCDNLFLHLCQIGRRKIVILLKKAEIASVPFCSLGATYYLPNSAKVFQFHDLVVKLFLFDNSILLKCADILSSHLPFR